MELPGHGVMRGGIEDLRGEWMIPRKVAFAGRRVLEMVPPAVFSPSDGKARC